MMAKQDHKGMPMLIPVVFSWRSGSKVFQRSHRICEPDSLVLFRSEACRMLKRAVQ